MLAVFDSEPAADADLPADALSSPAPPPGLYAGMSVTLIVGIGVASALLVAGVAAVFVVRRRNSVRRMAEAKNKAVCGDDAGSDAEAKEQGAGDHGAEFSSNV